MWEEVDQTLEGHVVVCEGHLNIEDSLPYSCVKSDDYINHNHAVEYVYLWMCLHPCCARAH